METPFAKTSTLEPLSAVSVILGVLVTPAEFAMGATVGAVGTTLSISRLEIVATAEFPAASVAVTRTS